MNPRRNGNQMPLAHAEEQDEVAKLESEIARTRASIESTLGEIEQTVSHAYRKVTADAHDLKAAVADTLDWRHAVRRHPVATAAGVLAVALLTARQVARGASNGSGGMAGARNMAGNYLRSGGRQLSSSILHELMRAGREIIVPALVARVVSHLDGRRQPGPPSQRLADEPGTGSHNSSPDK